MYETPQKTILKSNQVTPNTFKENWQQILDKDIGKILQINEIGVQTYEFGEEAFRGSEDEAQVLNNLKQTIEQLSNENTILSRNYELVNDKYETTKRQYASAQAKVEDFYKDNKLLIEEKINLEIACGKLQELAN